MKRMILVDGNSLMYRAYFGMAGVGNLTTNSKGLYTNAIYAFARMMNHLISSDYDAILVAFDAGKKTFRHEFMTDYKAGRAPMPDEMRMQIEFIKEYLDIMRIKRFEIPLYEADDIIGTMAKMGEDDGYHVDVYSSDKDLLQLISQNTTVHLTKKGMTDLKDFDINSFKEEYQIDYTQFVDLKALMGDKSDNLPGIPKIGEKKAIKYLLAYGSLDGIIEHKDEIKGADGENIRTYYEQALLCKKMATINTKSPINLTVNDILKKEINKERLIEFYQKMEFTSLLKEMSKDSNNENIEYKVADFLDLKSILVPNSTIMLEASDYNYHKSPILALGLVNEKGNFIIPLELIGQSIDLELFLADDKNHKFTYDYKRNYVLFKRLGYELNGIDFDLLMASYLINPSLGKEEFKVVCDSYEPSIALYEENVYGKGSKKTIPSKEVIYDHLIRKCLTIHKLKAKVLNKLKELDQTSLLTDIEIPLSKVLAKMEFRGMKIDTTELERQRVSLEERITNISKEIYELSGHEFNISSPKQLGSVMFDELAIPYPKKNHKNGYSTDADILNSILMLHPIVSKILEYRMLTKLNSTYVSGIKEMIYPDGCVHTIFQQALTQTGRLSSVEPNLQNIPIRSEEGHLVRKMYVPKIKGNSFYSADYSQIELRVLAHLANVSKLIKAFNNDEDIHSETAKEIFGKNEITKEERRQAKVVNFGIIYGMSAYGLATDLRISNKEAQAFIEKYNSVYPEIDIYMKNVLKECSEKGYVKTVKNRIRYIPDINSKAFMQREFAKRTAMNAPIQGSAADIIKIAMIDVDRELEKNKLESYMVVTVHDEIVLEVKKGEEEMVQNIVRSKMENAMKLRVPLKVSDSFGANWYEVK